MTDSYKDRPKSVSELRAGKAQDSALWTPRDALIHLLREVDNGLELDVVVICCATVQKNGDCATTFVVSSPNTYMTVGTVARVQHLLNQTVGGQDADTR